jgi:hypothetical protein
VIGVNLVGGLVGHNCGSITTSYSASTVTANCYVGGLVGRSYSRRSPTVGIAIKHIVEKVGEEISHHKEQIVHQISTKQSVPDGMRVLVVRWKQPAKVLLRQDCAAVVCVGHVLEGKTFLIYDVMLRVAYGMGSGRLTNMCENQLEKIRKIRPALKIIV